MPRTPRFQLNQDDKFIKISINVPYIRVSDAEIIFEGYDFTFYCRPYLLKLTFPCEFDVMDDENCKAQYDININHGTIFANIPKKNKGENFPNLDLTTLLLQKRIEKDNYAEIFPGISILDSTEESDTITAEEDEELSKAEINTETMNGVNISLVQTYGFNNKYSNVLGVLQDDLWLELEGNPDKIPKSQRRDLRLMKETELFDASRYLGDYFDSDTDPFYIAAIEYEAFWTQQLRKQSDNSSDFEFTMMEQDIMAKLPNRNYLIDKNSIAEKSVLFGLVDILFAGCYDIRFTQDDSNVESSSNVTRLSCTLSNLESYCNDENSGDSLLLLIIFSCRRALIYPYLRIWTLVELVLRDLSTVLFLGKRCILKVLFRLHQIFEQTESLYLVNKLYLTDYCVWVQSLDDLVIEKLSQDFEMALKSFQNSTGGGKEFLLLKLIELENWANSKTADDDIDTTIPTELEAEVPLVSEFLKKETQSAFLKPVTTRYLS